MYPMRGECGDLSAFSCRVKLVKQYKTEVPKSMKEILMTNNTENKIITKPEKVIK